MTQHTSDDRYITNNVFVRDMDGHNKGYVELSLFDDLSNEDNGYGSEAPRQVEYNLEGLFMRLARSPFRSRFRLSAKDRQYIDEKGLAAIRKHAEDFVARRLAPAFIPNDGKQTPMRGHPVFVAQHATGCCCRGCLYKWHHIPQGRNLSAEEQRYIVAVLMSWIEKQLGNS